ncbi:MAG: hypothetical protein FWD60_05975 [Candidatus Azobacteroides sp.]|nr:hypothetical protein [Candidatus Azobacteroides sp.]
MTTVEVEKFINKACKSHEECRNCHRNDTVYAGPGATIGGINLGKLYLCLNCYRGRY